MRFSSKVAERLNGIVWGGNAHSDKDKRVLQNAVSHRFLPFPEYAPFTIIDEGCDIPIVGEGWKITKTHGYISVVNGVQMKTVDAETVVYDPYALDSNVLEQRPADRRRVIVKLHHVAWDKGNRESLINRAVLDWVGASYTLNASSAQTSHISMAGKRFKLLSDRNKCFFMTSYPKEADYRTLGMMSLSKKGEQFAPSLLYTEELLDTPADPATIPSITSRQVSKRRRLTSSGLAEGIINPLNLDPTINRAIDSVSSEVDPLQFRFHNTPFTPEALGCHPEIALRSRRREFSKPGVHAWRPYQLVEWERRLAGCGPDIVRQTFKNTTQMVPSVQAENSTIPRASHIGRFPMLKVRRRYEQVSIDPVYLSQGADSGNKNKVALAFYGVESKHFAIYPLSQVISADKKTKLTARGADEIITILYEYIRDFGCPDTFKSDHAQELSQSKKYKGLCSRMLTQVRSSEAYKHEQNQVERAWQTIQARMRNIMQRENVPSSLTLKCAVWLANTWNLTANRQLSYLTPHQAMTGETPDISHLRFSFFDRVWFLDKSTLAGRKAVWRKGRFTGISWNVGDSMCYFIKPEKASAAPGLGNEVSRSFVQLRHPDESAPHQILKRKSDWFWPTVCEPNELEACKAENELDVQDNQGTKRSTVVGEATVVSHGTSRGRVTDSNDEIADPIPNSAETTGTDPVVEPPITGLSKRAKKRREKRGKKRKSRDPCLSPAPESTPGPEEHPIPEAQEEMIISPLEHDGPFARALRAKYLVKARQYQDALNKLNIPGEACEEEEYIHKIMSIRAVEDNCAKPSLQARVLVPGIAGGDERVWCSVSDLKVDAPLTLMRYILRKFPKGEVGGSNSNRDLYQEILTWATKVKRLQDKRDALRIEIGDKLGLTSASEMEPGDYGYSSRRRRERRSALNPEHRSRRKRTKKATGTGGKYKYGVYIPKNTKEALAIDKQNGNNLWRDAITKEVQTLQDFKTFKEIVSRKARGEVAFDRSKYQYAPLRCIYDVKENGTRKCRTIIGGHVIKTSVEDTYASNMKTMSARMLMCIAAANRLDVLVGDVTSAYLHASNKQKVFTRLCDEFELIGLVPGSAYTVEQALYGK